MTMSPMTSAAMNAVPVQKAGIASGVLSMFRMVGGSLGVAVTGAIFQGSVGADFSAATPAGSSSTRWRQAMGVSAAVTVGRCGGRRARDPIRPQARPVAQRRGCGGGGKSRWRAARRSRPAERAQPRPIAGQPFGSREVERRQRLDLDVAERRDRLAVRRSTAVGASGQGVSTTTATVEPGRPRGLEREQGVVDRAEAGRRGDRRAAGRGRRRGRAPGSRRRAGRAGRRRPRRRARRRLGGRRAPRCEQPVAVDLLARQLRGQVRRDRRTVAIGGDLLVALLGAGGAAQQLVVGLAGFVEAGHGGLEDGDPPCPRAASGGR